MACSTVINLYHKTYSSHFVTIFFVGSPFCQRARFQLKIVKLVKQLLCARDLWFEGLQVALRGFLFCLIRGACRSIRLQNGKRIAPSSISIHEPNHAVRTSHRFEGWLHRSGSPFGNLFEYRHAASSVCRNMFSLAIAFSIDYAMVVLLFGGLQLLHLTSSTNRRWFAKLTY